MHDTETYGKNSGKANGYGVDYPYPGNKIAYYESMGKSLLGAIYDFMDRCREYAIVKDVKESHGAIAMEKYV